MTAPRCTICDRIAVTEVEPGFVLCRRCEVILKREFPNVARQLSDPVPTPALAVMPGSIEQAAKAKQSSFSDPSHSVAERSAGVSSPLPNAMAPADFTPQELAGAPICASAARSPSLGARNETASFPDFPDFPDFPEFLRRIA